MGTVYQKFDIFAIWSPCFYTYDVWLKRTVLGNVRNPSTTQNFLRFAEWIARPAGVVLRFRLCIDF